MKLSLPPFLLGRRFRCRHCCSGDRRLLVRAVCSVTTTDDDLGQTAAGAVVGRRYTGTRESQNFAGEVGRGEALYMAIDCPFLFLFTLLYLKKCVPFPPLLPPALTGRTNSNSILMLNMCSLESY